MAFDSKTKEQPDGDVAAFLERAPRADDARRLCALMAGASGEPPRLWGPSIVGFGRRIYPLAGGRSGETLAMGFSPRKAALTLYLAHDADWAERLARLGPHGVGKGCLYIKSLAQVDLGTLKDLIDAAWAARTAGSCP